MDDHLTSSLGVYVPSPFDVSQWRLRWSRRLYELRRLWEALSVALLATQQEG